MLGVVAAIPLWPHRFGPRDALILLALCAAAYIGNMAAVSLFSGVDLLLGGVAVMFAAIRRSLVETVIVAVIGSLHTLVLWGHPYALVIFVLEAACVRLMYGRWGREITAYDAVFWLLAGVPLVLAFYGAVLGMDRVAVSLIALKQPVNGLLYAAVASLLHHALLLRQVRRSKSPGDTRFADLLAPMLITFALVPTLVVLSLYTQFERRQILENVHAGLERTVRDLVPAEPVWAGLGYALESWRDRLPPLGADDPAVALVDGDGVAVVEEPAAWLSRRPVASDVRPGLVKRQGDGRVATMAREHEAYYVHRVTSLQPLEGSGLDLMLGVRATPYVDRLRTLQLAALALASMIGLASVISARAVARRTGALLDPILTRLGRVPENLHKHDPEPWPAPPVTELRAVTDGLAHLEAKLTHQLGELAESERRYRAIANNLPGGVYQRKMTPDRRVHFTYLSPNYEQIFGIDPERALEEPQLLTLPIHPEDRPGYEAALERSADRLEALDVTFRLYHPDGRTRWVRSLGQPRREVDGTITWDGIAIDETARKEAEQRLVGHAVNSVTPLWPVRQTRESSRPSSSSGKAWPDPGYAL